MFNSREKYNVFSLLQLVMAVIILVESLLMCSCGENSDDAVVPDKSYNSYSITIDAMQDYTSYVADMFWYNNNLYVVVNYFSDHTDETCQIVYSYDKEGVIFNKFSLPSNVNVDCFMSIAEDNLIVTTLNNHLLFVDLNTGDITKELLFDKEIYGVAASETGYVVLQNGAIEKYNSDDVCISTVECDEWNYYFGLHPYFEENGKDYIVSYKNYSPTYYELDFDTSSYNEVISMGDVTNIYCDCYGKYLFDDNYEYEIDLENENLILLYSLNYTDIRPERFSVIENDIFVFDQEHFAEAFTYTNKSIDVNFYFYDQTLNMASRIPITIGGYDVNRDLAIRTAVYQFNTSQTEYRAIIEDYTLIFNWTTATDAQIKQAELMSYFNEGNAPDIFYGNSFDYDYMGRNNMIIDLSPYINNTDILSNASVSIQNFYDGPIYSVFPAYSISGYFSTKDSFVDNDLSLESLISYSEENDMVPIDRYTSVNIADILLRYSLRENYDKGGEHIYSREYLERVLNFSIDYGVSSVSNNIRVNSLYEVSGGIYPIAFATVSSVDDVYQMRIMDNGRFSFVGYPSINGSTHVINPIGRIAISSSSEKVDQCIGLIDILFSEETQTILSINHAIPINQTVLEECCQMNSYVSHEDIEDFYDMIDSIDTIAELDWGVYNIIAEEVESYYLYNKPIDEIAATLQNRLDLYASENY